MSSNAAAESSSSLLRYLKRDLAAVREEAKSKNGVKVSDASQHLSSFCRYRVTHLLGKNLPLTWI